MRCQDRRTTYVSWHCPSRLGHARFQPNHPHKFALILAPSYNNPYLKFPLFLSNSPLRIRHRDHLKEHVSPSPSMASCWKIDIKNTMIDNHGHEFAILPTVRTCPPQPTSNHDLILQSEQHEIHRGQSQVSTFSYASTSDWTEGPSIHSDVLCTDASIPTSTSIATGESVSSSRREIQRSILDRSVVSFNPPPQIVN